MEERAFKHKVKRPLKTNEKAGCLCSLFKLSRVENKYIRVWVSVHLRASCCVCVCVLCGGSLFGGSLPKHTAGAFLFRSERSSSVTKLPDPTSPCRVGYTSEGFFRVVSKANQVPGRARIETIKKPNPPETDGVLDIRNAPYLYPPFPSPGHTFTGGRVHVPRGDSKTLH